VHHEGNAHIFDSLFPFCARWQALSDCGPLSLPFKVLYNKVPAVGPVLNSKTLFCLNMNVDAFVCLLTFPLDMHHLISKRNYLQLTSGDLNRCKHETFINTTTQTSTPYISWTNDCVNNAANVFRTQKHICTRRQQVVELSLPKVKNGFLYRKYYVS